MRRLVSLLLLLCALPLAEAGLPAVASAKAGAQFWCPMHPDERSDARGTCPICRMDLVPVRLVAVWTCPVHGVIEEDKPGTCRICARALVQATRALTFTCAGHSEINQIDPGRCADGSCSPTP